MLASKPIETHKYTMDPLCDYLVANSPIPVPKVFKCVID
jgi:hypothetical protein